jgi:hypothetical protein
MFDMRRREFITLLGGTAVTGPRPVIAQTPSKVHRLGLLTAVAPMTDNSPFGATLIRGLAKYGYGVATSYWSAGRVRGSAFDPLATRRRRRAF